MTPSEPLIFLIAGEPSGDGIGGRLMAALRARSGGRIRFAGIGGPAMTGEGLDSLFSMSELAVMGVVEARNSGQLLPEPSTGQAGLRGGRRPPAHRRRPRLF